ncbi:MAG TPA: hypothetical protein VFQ49_15770 [Actinomycetes bacterium]|nr:hypothetical protein [Actinomycetes bacterium]
MGGAGRVAGVDAVADGEPAQLVEGRGQPDPLLGNGSTAAATAASSCGLAPL